MSPEDARPPRRPGPALIAGGVTLLLCLIQTARILAATGGAVLFTLDDPYIHLALAERLAQHLHYGLNPGEAASPSSSILYPFLLAPFVRLGLGEVGAWLLATLGASAAAALAARLIAGTAPPRTVPAGLLAASLAIAANLVGVAATGMEHGLHTAACLGILLGLAGFLRNGATPGWFLTLLLLCPLLRYEGLPLSLAALACLALRGRARLALTLAAVIAAILLAFSGFLVAHGLPPLPSSVLAKTVVDAPAPLDAQLADIRVVAFAFAPMLAAAAACAALLTRPLFTLAAGIAAAALAAGALAAIGLALGAATLPWPPGLASLAATYLLPRLWQPNFLPLAGIAAGLALALRQKRAELLPRGVIAAALAATLAQLAAGRFGWFNRYETYAIASGGAVLLACHAATLRAALGRPAGMIAALAAPLLLLSANTAHVLEAPRAAQFIALQQHQMGRFLREAWHAPAAVNDIGQTTWHNPNYVLDLWGLGSAEALRLRHMEPGTAWMADLAARHHVDLAMIYADAFGTPPGTWVRVGTLSVTTGYTALGQQSVDVCATNAAAAPRVRAAWEAFSRTLPPGAVWSAVGR